MNVLSILSTVVVVFVNVFVVVFDLNKQMLHVEYTLQLSYVQEHINVKFPNQDNIKTNDNILSKIFYFK
jgi:ABC-type nitrate/sulfonate/bicarbonate transport system permease component